MRFFEFIPLQYKLYLLMLCIGSFSYLSTFDFIYILGLILSIIIFISTTQKIDKEFILLNSILNQIKREKSNVKIKVGSFSLIETKRLGAHLNDIILFHQKTIKKAHFYNHSRKEKDHLAQTINIDEMTKLYKRNKFQEDLDKAFRKCKITNESDLFVAFLDIDHFKNVNDTHGHDIGDKILIQFSNEIIKSIKSKRKTDEISACRWGGEEFVILYFGINKDGVKKTLEDFRKKIEESVFPEIKHITVSIGFTQIKVDNINETTDALIKRADEGVYASKHNGRNQVTFID